jgi:hypothetical protein
MANTTSSPSATVPPGRPKRNKFLLIAAGPLLLLILAMSGLRLLQNPEDDMPDRSSLPGGTHIATPPSPIPPLDPAAEKEIIGTVNAQIDAFRRNDYVEALKLATPEFQQRTSPDAFRAMIEKGYKALAQTGPIRCDRAQNMRIAAGVLVHVQDSHNQEEEFYYQLVKIQSHWRVSTCYQTPLPGSLPLHGPP